MAFHNTNYEMLSLTGGTYTLGQLGNGLTAATVHEVYCISAGTISMTALGGGGPIAFPMISGQSVKILLASCTVNSGAYVGFKTKFNFSNIAPIQWGSNL